MDANFVINTIHRQRSGISMALTSADKERIPGSGTFPMEEWNEMSARYQSYWQWFDGTIFMTKKKLSKSNAAVRLWPMGINLVRTMARKHATILLGEEMFDTPSPLAKALVSPINPITGDQPSDEDEATAMLIQNIINAIWVASNGRSLQVENATLQQFLGGSIFRAKWDPYDDRLLFPIKFRNVLPDFFFPIWRPDEDFDLAEAYIVQRLSASSVNREWGHDVVSGTTMMLYVEHWTKDYYTVSIDGVPLEIKGPNGLSMKLDHVPNPFGVVPFVYIPHLREGVSWGSSHVPDIAGLTLEYNSRMRDASDAIRKTVGRQRYAINIQGTPEPITLENGVTIYNIGREMPNMKHPPEIITEDPPNLGDAGYSFPKTVWSQWLRAADMGDISFGEDEGSQRSALTLAFRMYPSTSHTRLERTHWTEGQRTLMQHAIKMLIRARADKYLAQFLPKEVQGIPDDFAKRFMFGVDWLPMIPRDREAMVNEIILRKSAGLISAEAALETFGDSRNVQDELKKIREDATFAAQMSGPQQSAGGEINTSVTEPIASDSMRD